MSRVVSVICVCVVLCGSACVQAQSIEGKKIVGGHGHAMVNTHQLKTYVEEMKRAPLDGILIAVNNNEYAADEKLRELRPHTWFRAPAVTIDDFSIALGELASTDLGHFKHNMLWCSGSRRFPCDWFDDDGWEKIILNNACVLAEVYKRGKFEALWFDVEVGGSPGGGVMTWKRSHRETLHSFEDYGAKTRQRGRELMQALTSVAPDFKLVISHAYGSTMKMMGSRGPEGLSEINYGLLPAFVDGLLEGCGEKGRIIESGEATYGTMTYAAFMAWRKWERLSAEKLCLVPQLLDKHYGYAMGVWPDFRSDSGEWHQDEIETNHFKPERMKHAFHNAMAASDEFVWTYAIKAHWWPNRAMQPSFDKLWRLTPDERKLVLPEAYCDAVDASRQAMDLDWHPEVTNETSAKAPRFDIEKAFATLADKYETIEELSDGWVFRPADSSTPSAFDWGMPLHTWGEMVTEVYDFQPIELGDAWENQGVALDGTGVYRRRITLDEDARKKRLYLAIGGIAGKATVYVARQGARPKSVGRTEGKALTLFDITEALDLAGISDLAIVVHSPKGAGGIYGAAQIVATEKGTDGYAEMRGQKKGEWFQWIRDTRLGNLKTLELENTVEARVRVPNEVPLTAQIYCSTADGGWTVSLDPKGVKFASEYIALNATQWHTYRVVVARANKGYAHTLFVDGKEKLKLNVAPVKSEKPRGSAIGLGIGWGNEGTHAIKMDVDYIRWANRSFTPEDERNAARNVPEAQKRKEVFWDGTYEGNTMPDADGWKWWYHHDGRPFTRIVPMRESLDISDPSKLVGLYDWKTGHGATLILRDVPRLDMADEVHATIRSDEQKVSEDTFAAKIVLRSAEKLGYEWPAITLTEMNETDWSAYAAVAVRLHNPTTRPQVIGFSVRDSDRQIWHRLETFAPGETRVLSVTIHELRSKVLISDVWTLTLWTHATKTPQTFLASPVYLVRE